MVEIRRVGRVRETHRSGLGLVTFRWGSKTRTTLRIALVCCALAGCQQKMASQPSFRPDDPSPLFADGRAARPLVAGTVARGHLRTDSHFFTGKRTPASNAAAFRAAAVAAGTANPLMALATA